VINKRSLIFFDVKNEENDITLKEEKLSPDQVRKELSEVLDLTWEWDTFSKRLRHYIKKRKLKSKDLYERAYIDRRLLHKIITKKNYHPSKKTAFALCIALELSFTESVEFIGLANYAFATNNKYDQAIAYFLRKRIYDIQLINECLYDNHLECFGE